MLVHVELCTRSGAGGYALEASAAAGTNYGDGSGGRARSGAGAGAVGHVRHDGAGGRNKRAR